MNEDGYTLALTKSCADQYFEDTKKRIKIYNNEVGGDYKLVAYNIDNRTHHGMDTISVL
jgi:hypothetical protein